VTPGALTGSAVAPGRILSADRAYVEIRRRIIENEMPAGSVVLEQDLAQELGMSRTPVREAMIHLANEGLVEVRPRHGFRVLPISVKDMIDIYEILTALESTAAASLARDGATDQQLATLEGAVEAMDGALAINNLDAWAAADERFHKMLVAHAGNQRLLSVVEMFWDQTHRARMVTLRLRPKPTRSNDDHRAVINAIRARDPVTAQQQHTQHRTMSGQMLVELIEKYKLRSI
jgi:DNA-binding GntR family transcriptional regulator